MAVDPRRREGIALFVLILLAAGAYGASLLDGDSGAARAMVRREDGARDSLLALLKAEEAHRAKSGRFGEWSDLLASNDAPPGFEVVGAPGDPHVERDGYRIDILLPVRMEAGQLVRVGLPVRRRPDPDLVRRHVTLVARPLVPARDGYRIYATDEAGFVWISEGVSDETTARRNPLPDAHLSTSSISDTSGCIWIRSDQLVPFGDGPPPPIGHGDD